jgi:hypothetical protein
MDAAEVTPWVQQQDRGNLWQKATKNPPLSLIYR